MSFRLLPQTVLVCLAVLLPSLSEASTIIDVNAQADYTGSIPSVLDLLGGGTTVTADLKLNVGTGDWDSAPIDASGMFTWNNGGLHTYTVSGAFLSSGTSSGALTFHFPGSGPTVNGTFATPFIMRFNIGTNPFTSPDELSDLLLNGAIIDMRVGAAHTFGVIHDTINGNLSGTIQEGVPEPSTIVGMLPQN